MTNNNQPKKIDLNILAIKSARSAEELEGELEDLYLCEIAKERRNGKMIAVKLEDLKKLKLLLFSSKDRFVSRAFFRGVLIAF